MSGDLRLDGYLARIGYDGTIAADLATLAGLHAAHVNAIPFEDLDPLLRRPVRLDLASLQDKLVDNRRGGYCFEQNVLFKAVLEAIGFTVTGLTARVRWMSPPDSPLSPREHMLLKVDLPEGSYLADVGFGACLLEAPLQLRTGIEQRTAMGNFRLAEADGHYWLSAWQPDGWRVMYAFDLHPQIHADYELGNWYAATCPDLPFLGTLIMERLSRDRRYKLIDRRFVVERRDGEVASERVLGSPEEMRQIIEQTFNVVPPAPAEEIFARLGA